MSDWLRLGGRRFGYERLLRRGTIALLLLGFLCL
jgi:hypothetical protein